MDKICYQYTNLSKNSFSFFMILVLEHLTNLAAAESDLLVVWESFREEC